MGVSSRKTASTGCDCSGVPDFDQLSSIVRPCFSARRTPDTPAEQPPGCTWRRDILRVGPCGHLWDLRRFTSGRTRPVNRIYDYSRCGASRHRDLLTGDGPAIVVALPGG